MTDERPLDVTLENRLMGQGIYVTDCELRPPDDDRDDPDLAEGDPAADETAGSGPVPDGTGLDLEYETVAESPGVSSHEVGVVVRTLLDIAAEREWSPGRLEATSLTTEGEVRGHWHVERDWFDGLGLELDDLEFSERVLGTRRSERTDE